MNSFVKTLLGFCFVLCLSQAVFSATYTVTKIADTNDGMCDSDCSLREAVAAANATADNDIIVFSSLFSTAQTITLSGTEITINNNGSLVINGRGANLTTISGNSQSRVFLNNTGAVTFIENLRVTGGSGVSTANNGLGGAIRNTAGTLTLTRLVVNGNAATNGGGLSNGGTGVLTLDSCTVSGNTASASGGGMQNFSGAGNITNILNSTFSGNTSNSTTVGGGAIQGNGVLFISNSTFSGNTVNGGSGGGIYYNGQGITLNNVTIANNTSTGGAGGFHKAVAANTANLRNNLIAGNTGGAAPDVSNVINSLGNNLIQAVGTSTGWIASDILNQPANLAPLANNGGLTQTHALLANSLAINAGNNCVTNASCAANNPQVALTTDQRGAGFARQVGAAVDIGAFESGAGTLTTVRAPFDFDGDGRTDFAVFRPSNATWYLNRSTGGFFATQFGLSSDRLVPADYDGDGKTDIAVWREASFSNFYILNSTNNTFRSEQFGSTGDDPGVVGDWDGDGKADLAVYRRFVGLPEDPPTSIFYYRPSATPGVNFRSISWGLNTDRQVVGDYDGDGKRDAAVFRPSTRTWYILQSSNNGQRFEQWGLATDRQVPADYDGDGKIDVAIFRDGLWAILQSSNSQPRYQQFGQAGDQLVPGDYDGDGKIDLAVWRSGVFYVLRSNGSQLETNQFGTSGDVPVASAFIP